MNLIVNVKMVRKLFIFEGNNNEMKSAGTLTFQKGIEVGQTFYLGDKYSKAMKANFNDYSNALVPLEMVYI